MCALWSPRARDGPPPEVVDEVRASYDAWRNACAAVERAYERWATRAAADRDVGFGGYLAALQQEEHAARVYQVQLELTRGEA